ncbi:hypothetical protein MHU86_9087 [Fragilaria crotonensis]|nr:hypothetical protein MHU86_9087 [Fragilaria crotonensis]
MAETGIASKLNKKFMLDKSGETVEHKTEAFGLPTDYMMRRPDKLVFVDEVGSNTSTTKDGNVGGEKFLCGAAGRPQIKAATKDSHFTVMGFTAATGKPVLCAIIFKAMKMCRSWVLGFNGSAPLIGKENDMQRNSGGINNRYPQGLKAFDKRKRLCHLPCFDSRTMNNMHRCMLILALKACKLSQL